MSPKSKAELLATPQIERLLEQAEVGQLRGPWLILGEKGSGTRWLIDEIVTRQHQGAPKHGDIDLQVLEEGAKVEEVREALKLFRLTPTGFSSRILVIRDISQLNHYGVNALLKTLEEPPEYGLILVEAPTEDKVLPTVASRCFKVKVPVVGGDELLAWLKELGAPEHIAEEAITLAYGRPELAEILVEDEARRQKQSSLRTRALGFLGKPLPERLAWAVSNHEREELLAELEVMTLELAAGLRRGETRSAQAFTVIERALRMVQSHIHPKLVLAHAALVLGKIGA